MDNHQQPVRRSQRLLSYLICTLIAGQPLLPAVAAAITPVTPGSQMDKAGNGVPVLNIATPNQAGISHNQFSDYNVGKPGLILNNATDRLTQTQLGGLLQNNPNLKAGKEARGIINEVVGGNRSQLQGFTEVAGKAANVMVVNPYGITCNGCGFINTPQVTLTTGKPTFDSKGNVSSLAVSKGTIIVEGQGLNASQSDALSLIARATEINADIHARDLTVIAGSNRVDAQGKVTAQDAQGAQPSVAVDTGALGGMYANRIRLVSSDKGVGVNLGNLNARQGDITLDASGKLTLNNSLASGALNVRAGAVALGGDHKAGGDITVNSDGDVAVNNAALVSDRDVLLSAGKNVALESGKLTAGRDVALLGEKLALDNTSQANAGGDIRATATSTFAQQGQLTAGQDLTLKADALDNRGALAASRNLSARATTLSNSGTIQSSDDVTASGSQLKNKGKILSGGSLTLSGDRLDQNGTLSAKTQASLALSDRLTQGAQGEILSDGLLSIHAGQLEQQGLLSGDRGVNFSGDGLNQQQGARITSQQAIDLQADLMQLGGEVNAGGDLELNAGTLTTQSTAQVQSGGNLKLDAQKATLNGTHAARGDLSASATTLNHNGKSNAERIALNANSLNNHGTLVAPELSLNTQHLTNGGLLEASQSMQLQASQFDNLQSATLHSVGDLMLDLPVFNNSGLVTGENALILKGESLTNAGEINAHNLTTTHQIFNNVQSGLLFALETLSVGGGVLGNSGQMVAKNLHLQGNDFNNSGLWQSSTMLDAQADRLTTEKGSRTVSAGALTLNIKDMSTHGTLQGDTLTLIADNLQSDGMLLGNRGMAITVGHLEQLENGQLLSGGHLNVTGNSFTSAGQTIAADDLSVDLQGDFTHEGILAAGHQLTLRSQGAVSNSGIMQGLGINLSAGTLFSNSGKITSGNIASSLNGGQIDLADSGSVQAGGDITLTSQSDINIAGFTAATGSMTLVAPASIINSALLYSGKNMRLLANSVLNRRGDILAEDNLWIQRDAAGNANSEIVNTSGTIETRSGNISLATAHLLNQRDGLTYSVEEKNYYPATAATIRLTLYSNMLQLKSHESCAGGANPYCRTVTNLGPRDEYWQQKLMVSEKKVTVNASGGASTILAGQDLVISAGKLENKASNLLAGRKMNLQGNIMDNDSLENNNMQVWQTYKCGGLTWTEPCNYSSNTLPSKETFTYTLIGGPVVENLSTGSALRAVIQAGSSLTASFTSNISNTTTRANAGTVTSTLAVPVLNTLSQPEKGKVLPASEQLHAALQQLHSGSMLDSNGKPVASLTNPQGKSIDTSAWPLPSGNNGYFVSASDPKSPYLIVTNPQLDGLGKLDQNLFGDLNALLGKQPGSAPQETRSAFTDQKQFLGSSYLLDRLNLNPEHDYRLLGDAAFDTRYVSNALLNQTGNRYLNGVGSDLEQMRYLLDNAASAQQSLGLKFGVSLNAKQVAALDHSIVWWEATQINGETVMVPKLYLSPKDITVNSGSVIAANSVELNAGTLKNNGSTLAAKTDLTINSQNSISNLNAGLISAAGDMNLSALGDINNIGSAISGKTLTLESLDGSINNQTLATQWNASSKGRFGSGVAMSQTQLGTTATMSAQQGVTLKASKDITVTGSKVTAGGELKLDAAGDIAINANQTSSSSRYTEYAGKNIASSGKVGNVGSNLSAGGALTLNAGNDLSATASAISATKDLSLSAGHDLNLNAANTAQRSSKGKGENHVTGQDRTLLTSGNDLTLSAGRDLNSQAAGLVADNDVKLQAGRDVNLRAATTTKGDSYRSSERTEIHEAVRQLGTEIASGGNTTVQAGRDINSAAATVKADDLLALQAGRDVNLNSAQESDYAFKEEVTTRKGFLKKTTTHTIQENYKTSAKGTQLTGDAISVVAGHDVTATGAAIGAESSVTLQAGNDVNVLAATEKASTYSLHEVKKSGLMGGGLSIGYGKQSAKTEYKGAKVTQSDARSLVGASAGNVIIVAGNTATVKGSDIIASRAADDTTRATGHIDITGANIAIISGEDRIRESLSQTVKSSGFGLTLTGTPLDTVRNLRDIVTSSGNAFQKVKAFSIETGASLGDTAQVGLSYSRSSANSQQSSDSVYQSGSKLTAAGNTQLHATGKENSADSGNLLVAGSSISAGEDAILEAKNQLSVVATTDSQKVSSSNKSSNWSVTTDLSTPGAMTRLVGGTPNHGTQVMPVGMQKDRAKSDGTYLTQNASSVTGNHVALTSSEGNILLAGSTLTGTQGVSVLATRGQVTATSGENSQVEKASGSSSTLGSLGSDGYSGTLGWGQSAWQQATHGKQQSVVRSAIVSDQGDVTIASAGDTALNGTDVYAGNNLKVNGQNIVLGSSQDSTHSNSSSQSAQYGITTSVSGYAVTLAQAAEKISNSLSGSDDPRLRAIYAAQAALTIASTITQNTAAFKVTVKTTVGSSHQSQQSEQVAQQGTVLKAVQDVTLTANQDISGSGVQVAGKNVTLDAGRDIALRSAQDSYSQQSNSGGNQYGAGVGLGGGGGQNGFTIELSASQSSAKADGSGLTHHNSAVNASDKLVVNSDRDIILKGSNLSGNRVEVNAGRDLLIASQQDKAKYDSKDSSSGFSASICVPPICAGTTVQGSANISGSQLYNNYASVQQQSGIAAGSGGYDVFVGNHTQLDGAIIASTADADKNHLSTGTLGWSSIDNVAKQSATGFNVSVALSGPPSAGLQQVKDSTSSTTVSAVSPGSIEIRNAEQQKQDIATLSRDTANANAVLENNFDAQKMRDHLAVQREMAALGQQAIGYASTMLTEKAKEEAKAAALARLSANPANKDLSAAEMTARVLNSDEYKQAEAQYGIGSDFQIGANAIVGALSALAGGNAGGALAAASGPLLAQVIKQASGKNEAMRVVLHTVVSGLLAQAQGGSAIGGAAGGLVSSVGAEPLSQLLYGKSAALLTQEQKELVANLATLAGMGAGAAVGGSTGAGSGGVAAKVEVENNYLSQPEKTELELAKKKLNDPDPAVRAKAQQDYDRLTELDVSRDQKVIDACGNGQAKSAGCASARQEAFAARGTYEAGPYNSPFSKQYPDAYGQIVSLLNKTTESAQQQQQVTEGLTQYFMAATGVDYATAKRYAETKQGADIIMASVSLGVNAQAAYSYLVSKGAVAEATATNAGRDKLSGPTDNWGSYTSKEKFIQSLTPTDHIVVSAGKAPKTSTPNSVYEVSRADGTKSITYYDEKGRTFSREDYGQQQTHGSLGYDENGKVPPHEHRIIYDDRGYVKEKIYSVIGSDGNAVGPWMIDK